jgi:hypothetical protein
MPSAQNNSNAFLLEHPGSLADHQDEGRLSIETWVLTGWNTEVMR